MSVLNEQQFMGVDELLTMPSTEAMRPYGAHSGKTTVASLYARKAQHIAERPEVYHQLDEPIRNGSIDPVLLGHSGGHTAVDEGHHRIVRAHQLGVAQLPISHTPDSQAHAAGWDDD